MVTMLQEEYALCRPGVGGDSGTQMPKSSGPCLVQAQRRSSPCFLSRNPSSLLSLAWPSRLEFFLFLIKTDSAGCQGWQGTQGHLLLAALCVGNEEFAM